MPDRRELLAIAGLAALATKKAGAAMAAADRQPDMRASISASERELAVTYSVSNPTDQPLYVTNKLHRVGSGPAIDPAQTYGWIGAPGRTLYLAKILAPIPEGRSPTSLVAPYMTRIDPGATLREAFSVPLPFHPRIEYEDNSLLPDAHPIYTNAVVFLLGWFRPAVGSSHMSDVVDGMPVDNFRNPPGRFPDSGQFRSDPFALDVPVLPTRAMRPH